MCVIMIAETKPLTAKMMKQANEKNPDGLGLAWNDGTTSHYRKNLTLDEALKLRTELPLPYVFHARYATEGGVKPTLCHPFPITTKDSRRESGKAPRLLFHNGHWKEWEVTVKRMVARYDVELPDGPMSDSRAMAWIVATVGEGVLDMPHGQKYALLDSDGVHRYGKGWVAWRGYTVSNIRWLPVVRPTSPTKPIAKQSWLQRGLGFSNAPRLNKAPKKQKQTAKPAEPKGFYTVPMEGGGAMLVKARSSEQAFEIAGGARPGWRRQMASSGDVEGEVQTLTDWMASDHTTKRTDA
jgi:hypothetical protein